MSVTIGHTPLHRATLSQIRSKPDLTRDFPLHTTYGVISALGLRPSPTLKEELLWVLDNLNELQSDVINKLKESTLKYENYIGSDEYMFLKTINDKLKRLL